MLFGTFSRQDDAMPHCDLGMRSKIASDLRSRAAISGPNTALSEGVLTICWLWRCQIASD